MTDRNRVLMRQAVLTAVMLLLSVGTAQAQSSFGSPGGGFGSAGSVGGAYGGGGGVGGFGSPGSMNTWQGSATVVPEAGGGLSVYDHSGRTTAPGATQSGVIHHRGGATSKVLNDSHGAVTTGPNGVNRALADPAASRQD